MNKLAMVLASGMALAVPYVVNAAPLYTDSVTGYQYSWTRYDSTSTDTSYIDNFRIYVRADTSGVDYYFTKVLNSGDTTTNGALTDIGIYTSAFLTNFLSPSFTLSDSDAIGQEDVVYSSFNGNSLNGGGQSAVAFSAVDSDAPVISKSVNSKGEWLNIHFNYLSSLGATPEAQMAAFLNPTTGAMFSDNHFIQVHIQETGTNSANSEKWKLTWVKGGGGDQGCFPGSTEACVPEPSETALLGIGLLGMGVMRKIKSRRLI